VRRPADPDAFDGTVFVEWLNVTAGVDGDPDFGLTHPELLEHGSVYVGVSAQRAGIEGVPVLQFLTETDLFGVLGFHRARQDDSDRLRTWEVAGTAHADRSILDYNAEMAQEVAGGRDSKREEAGDKPETVTFEGVIPDHDTVIALTNAVSEQGFYVKRVIENPPRTGGRANVVNRYWDIAGRRYLGVYPIDFHLILTGEEVYMGEIRAQAGTTRTAIISRDSSAVTRRINHLRGLFA